MKEKKLNEKGENLRVTEQQINVFPNNVHQMCCHQIFIAYFNRKLRILNLLQNILLTSTLFRFNNFILK